MKTLPELPSALIRLALKDLAAVEKSDRYVVNMGVWHQPGTIRQRHGVRSRGPCEVCLAGAVMAKTLKLGTTKPLLREKASWEHGTEMKLRALDSFREGYIRRGLHGLGVTVPPGIPHRFNVTSYDNDPVQWRIDMFTMVNLLEEYEL